MCKPNSQAIDNSLHDPESWSINKISKEFGASQRLAKKAKNLRISILFYFIIISFTKHIY